MWRHLRLAPYQRYFEAELLLRCGLPTEKEETNREEKENEDSDGRQDHIARNQVNAENQDEDQKWT